MVAGILSHYTAKCWDQTASIAKGAKDTVSSLFISCFSPKQSMRHESLWESFQYTRPTIAGFCTLQSWKLWKTEDKNADQYRLTLQTIKKCLNDAPEALSISEKELLASLFEQNEGIQEKLDHLHLLFAYRKDLDLIRSHRLLLRMLSMQNDSTFKRLCSKTAYVSECLQGKQNLASDALKLGPLDCALLFSSPMICRILVFLQNQGIPNLDLLLSRWETIHAFAQSELFSQFKKLCIETYPPGSIFIPDWQSNELFSGRDYVVEKIIRKLAMGKWCHACIIVKSEDKEIAISHVQGSTKKHAISPIDPSIIPLDLVLALDIAPLIPKTVNKEDCTELQNFFVQTFHEMALEPRPEITIAETETHLKMAALGHIALRGHPLSQAALPDANGRITCSAYVATLFLMAIEQVNQALKEKGYQEQIAHPFGTHEWLEHVDVLRLLYLWNNLGVIKEIKAHPTIAKVMALPVPLLDPLRKRSIAQQPE